MSSARVLFYMRDNRGEKSLTASMMKGIERHKDACRAVLSTDFQKNPDWGGAEIVFIGRSIPGSKTVMDQARKEGVQFIYYDKGYFNRGWKTQDPEIYYRYSANSFQPLDYFQALPRPSDRWDKLGITPQPRKRGERIIMADYSDKFASFYGLEGTNPSAGWIEEIKKRTAKPLHYRSRLTPRSTDDGDAGRTEKMGELLENAHALVTFSSNAAVDAVLSGVPAFVLGPGIAKPVSNTDLSNIDDPWFPTDKERLQWCYDLAYCQWRVDEMEDGSLWNYLKGILAYAH